MVGIERPENRMHSLPSSLDVLDVLRVLVKIDGSREIFAGENPKFPSPTEQNSENFQGLYCGTFEMFIKVWSNPPSDVSA